MTEKMVKGAFINGYFKFIKKRWGQIGLEEAMKYAGVKWMPKDGDWVPTSEYDKVLEWIAKNKGMNKVKEGGRYSARDLGVFGYMFGAIVGPEELLNRIKEAYPIFFSYGDLLIDMEKEGNRVIITFKGASLTEYDCPALEGGLIGLMEITRSNGRVKVLEPDSPEDCKFMVEWD